MYDELLSGVKYALGISGEALDNTLRVYIIEVANYMISAGVPAEIAVSQTSIGVISRGVTDLWNYGSGNGKLSEYFYQRVCQLAYSGEVNLNG